MQGGPARIDRFDCGRSWGTRMTDAKASRVRWWLIFSLFLLSAVAYLDRVNISVAGGLLSRDYNFSKTQLGGIFSAFLAGYALFQTVGCRLPDRLRPTRLLPPGLALW